MGNPTIELQCVTRYMGSYNVTCHPIQAKTPSLNPDQ